MALTELLRVITEQSRPRAVRDLDARRVAQAKEEKFATFRALARSGERATDSQTLFSAGATDVVMGFGCDFGRF